MGIPVEDFWDVTDQHLDFSLILVWLFTKDLWKSLHLEGILYTICMDRYYKRIVLHFF